MSQGIYKITNILNKKSYIGKSLNIEKRWTHHKRYKNNIQEKNKTLYKAFSKYGLENFTFEIIDYLTNYKKDCNSKEKYWIEYYDTYKNGYNETQGGDGGITVPDPRKTYGKITTDEVIYLRHRYLECKYPASYIWECEFKNKITKRGFQAIWLGQNAKNIMPEVFTPQNKQKQIQLSRAYEGVLRRRVSLKEKNKIKERIKNGEKPGTIWRLEYKNIYKSLTGFLNMLEAISLDEEVVLNGKLESL